MSSEVILIGYTSKRFNRNRQVNTKHGFKTMEMTT